MMTHKGNFKKYLKDDSCQGQKKYGLYGQYHTEIPMPNRESQKPMGEYTKVKFHTLNIIVEGLSEGGEINSSHRSYAHQVFYIEDLPNEIGKRVLNTLKHKSTFSSKMQQTSTRILKIIWSLLLGVIIGRLEYFSQIKEFHKYLILG